MILYHGTDENSAKDILLRGIVLALGNERADFGQGFYTTPDKQMAEKWAARKGVMSRGAVISFLFDESSIPDCLSTKRFDQADLIWAQFVANNRNGFRYIRKMEEPDNNLYGQYDIVIGPTADGDVANITRALEADALPVSSADVEAMTQRVLSWQYSFHTQAGVALLNGGRIRLV